MEHTLGVPILDRSPRGVEPTQYGRALLKRGIAAFDEIAQAVKDIDFLADPTVGELCIGTTPGLAEGIVLSVLERLSAQYPRVIMHLIPGGLHIQYEALRQRRIEFGFGGVTDPITDDDIVAETLYEEPLTVVAALNNPWSQRRKIRLAELIDEPWTWPTAGTIIDKLVIEAFRSNGVEPPRATVYADAYSLRLRLAAGGRFLAIVPASIMKFPGKPGAIKVLPVELATTGRKIGIITLRNRTLSPWHNCLSITHGRSQSPWQSPVGRRESSCLFWGRSLLVVARGYLLDVRYAPFATVVPRLRRVVKGHTRSIPKLTYRLLISSQWLGDLANPFNE